MPKFSAKTLETIKTLYEGVDGAHRIEIKSAEEHTPKGTEQDIEIDGVTTEWVDQTGSGWPDEYWGTVTWKLGGHYLIAHFAT